MVANQKQVTASNVDPLEFMQFLNNAKTRLYVQGDTTGFIEGEDGEKERMTWQDVMYDVIDALEEHAVGRFWCGLGRESSPYFTDDACEIAVYLADPQDEAFLRANFTIVEDTDPASTAALTADVVIVEDKRP